MAKHIAGDMLWRACDNRLFIVKEVIHDKIYVLIDPLNIHAKSEIQYVNVPAIDDMVDDAPYIDHVDTTKLPWVGQHVWKLRTDKRFRVEKVVDTWRGRTYDPEGPCNKCFNGKCEQCNWGYRKHDDIMKEYNELYKPENHYQITLLSVDGKQQDCVNLIGYNNLYTPIPPNISELTKKVISYEYEYENKTQYERIVKLVESDMIKEGNVNEDIDMTKSYGGYQETIAEAIENTEKDSYQKWKDSLHVVNVPKFDLKYFIRKKAYYIKRHQGIQLEADALLMSVSEDELEFLRIEGGKIADFQASELVKIPIKEYLNGTWTIKRLGGDE